jgi:hypothetical protein
MKNGTVPKIEQLPRLLKIHILEFLCPIKHYVNKEPAADFPEFHRNPLIRKPPRKRYHPARPQQVQHSFSNDVCGAPFSGGSD